MDTLRVILIVIGVIIVALVYFITRRGSDAGAIWPRQMRFKLPVSFSSLLSRLGRREQRAALRDAQVDAEAIEEVGRFVPERRPLDPNQLHSESVKAGPDSDHIAPGGEELVISLTVIAKDAQPFGGEAIARAADELGLRFGPMDIYHSFAGADTTGPAVCSVANMFEPGHLRVDSAGDFETRGLALFMVLPGPREPREAFDHLLRVGEGLAEKLDGELCDERRSVLTRQTIGHLKERIESYRFKQRMAHLQQRGAK